MNGFDLFRIILWGGLVVYGLYLLYQLVMGIRAAKAVDSEAFRQDMRKVQIVDVRERPEYTAGRILGARNVPLTQFKDRHKELRRDQPIYLYGQRTFDARRAATRLKKSGYQNIVVLKGGYDSWDGKIKKG